jgi:hypothetical protein
MYLARYIYTEKNENSSIATEILDDFFIRIVINSRPKRRILVQKLKVDKEFISMMKKNNSILLSIVLKYAILISIALIYFNVYELHKNNYYKCDYNIFSDYFSTFTYENENFIYFPQFFIFYPFYLTYPVFVILSSIFLLLTIILIEKIHLDEEEKLFLLILAAVSFTLDLYRGNTNMFILFFTLSAIHFLQKNIPNYTRQDDTLQDEPIKNLKTPPYTNKQIFIVDLCLALVSFKLNYFVIVALIFGVILFHSDIKTLMKFIFIYVILMILLNFQWVLHPEQINQWYTNGTHYSINHMVNNMFESNQLVWIFTGVLFFLFFITDKEQMKINSQSHWYAFIFKPFQNRKKNMLIYGTLLIVILLIKLYYITP